MSEDLSPSSPQNVEYTKRIKELDQQVIAAEAQIGTLEQQLSAAAGQQRMDLENQIRALVAARGSLVEEANTLRIQLGLPVVVPNLPLPSIMTDQPAGRPADEWSTTRGA